MGINNTIPCINCVKPTVCINNGACLFDFVNGTLAEDFDEDTDDGFSLLSEAPGEEFIKEY